MGKQTLYHPVSLHVVRGAAEYCGFKFGKLKQVKSDPTGLTATYSAQIVELPKAVKHGNIEYIRQALADCFNADIKVLAVRQSTTGSLTCTLRTCIYCDPEILPLETAV